MELTPGYRLTEAGALPKDWEVAPLRDLGVVVTGSTPPTRDDTNYGDEFLFVSPADIDEQKRITRTGKRLSTKGFSTTRRFPRDSILFVCIGSTIGKCGIADIELTANQQINAILPSDTVSPEYLYYALLAAGPRVRAIAGQQAVPLVNKAQFSETRIAVPTLTEQRAIAASLNDLDALLDGLARLIAKKRDLKQAAMQQLLAGRTRLPGFRAEWRRTCLGEHVQFLKNGAFSRADLVDDGNVKYLHYGDIHMSTAVRLDPSRRAMPFLPEARARCLDRLVHGDLVFVDASEDRDGIGKSVEIVNPEDAQAVAGLHTIAARFDKTVLADGFKAYLQYCPPFASQLRRLAAGTKVYATTRAHIASVELSLPSPEEQTAIATVLSDMDSELAALEARLEKTKALKQAMMQELLTGRTRLVAPEPAHA